jgi:hypothetical protein
MVPRMNPHLPRLALGVLLLAMTGLMLGPMREETATVDETTFMGGGYAYLKGGTAKMSEENPILSSVIMALPMLAFDVHLSDQARAIMEMKAVSPVGWPWSGPPRPVQELFPAGLNFYHYGLAEAQMFGKILVYDPRNDAEALLFWARATQAVLTLATTVFVFWWTRRLTGQPWAGVLAAALWGLNPLTLAYGHLAITEPGLALMFPIAVWWFARTVEAPTTRNILLLGALTAVAMQMKFLAMMLGPVFVLGLIILGNRGALPKWNGRQWAKAVGLCGAAFWGTMLLIYFPHWSPAPPLPAAQADALRVPGWFQVLRPVLIPADFFKAFALKLLHSQAGQDAFLCGEWRKMGWWYYYPLAMWFKTPLPVIALTVAAAVMLARRLPGESFGSWLPWLAALVYVGAALPSKINIGVRHMLTLYPLLAVGVADQIWRSGRPWRIAAGILTVWLAVIAVVAWPHYIPYGNEFAGGTANGYQKLIDSNYDWGQDGKRLKHWMQANDVAHVYLDFFGTQTAIEWHQIPNTRVNAEQARHLRAGWLVVSVSQLMRPEWDWLRQARPTPDARIGYTLFAYRLP